MEITTETEQRIILAAEKLFYKKGKAGTSMQDIADEAGITRTSLNYYFRTKDKLFESVFRNAMGSFIPVVTQIIRNKGSLKEQVPEIVSAIIDMLIANPQIPIFVLQELSVNSNRMPGLLADMGVGPALAKERMPQSLNIDGIEIDPRQMIISILSLCIFPFAARSIVQNLFYGGDEEQYIMAMKERKEIIPVIIGKVFNSDQL